MLMMLLKIVLSPGKFSNKKRAQEIYIKLGFKIYVNMRYGFFFVVEYYKRMFDNN